MLRERVSKIAARVLQEDSESIDAAVARQEREAPDLPRVIGDSPAFNFNDVSVFPTKPAAARSLDDTDDAGS